MPMPNHASGKTTHGEDWKAPSAPHGYDLCEFDPRQDPGVPRRARPHAADEERQRLRRVQAALDADAPAPAPDPGARDQDQDEVEVSGRSRLYRE